MSPVMIGVLGMAIFLVLLFLGLNVPLSMLVASSIGLFFFVGRITAVATFISSAVFSNYSNYVIAVAPLFMIMGELASESGIGAGMFDTISKLTGHKRGGLASATMVVCGLFGAVCGNPNATTAMMSRVAYPEMKKRGYNMRLSGSTIGLGSALSIVIPPSLPLVQYAVVTQESIGQLFAGGISTGIVNLIVFVITIKIICRIHKDWAPVSQKFGLIKALKSGITSGFLELILVFALTMGTMFAGLITPTEAGAVGIFALIVVSIIFKRFTVKKLINALINTALFTGMLYVLLVGATMFSTFCSYTRIPVILGEWVLGLNASKWVILLAITVVYLILGCFIEPASMVLLTAPIFYPVIVALGFNGIWFGMYILMVAALGGATPPVGLGCYYISAFMPDIPLQVAFRSMVPWIVSLVFMIVLIAILPQICTWLPSVLF